jgi:hypothetical protein
MRAQPPDIDDPERRLTLRQADQAREDFAAILDELAFLRNRQLPQYRDILAKAAAWFARETAVIPSGSSNS